MKKTKVAKSSPAKTKSKPAPAKAKPAPAKSKPAPAKSKPAPAKAKPAPAKAKAKPAQAPAAPDPSEAAPAKHYKLTPEQLQPIAPGYGACIASDKITVEGHPVRFMYREAAVHEVDSGWRFLAGIESDAYVQEPSNHAFYDCNTIANYDRSIVPYLESPVGSVFEKPPGAADFEPVADWTPDSSDEPPADPR